MAKKELRKVPSINMTINRELANIDIDIIEIKKVKEIGKKRKLLQIVKQKKALIKKAVNAFSKTIKSMEKDYSKLKKLDKKFESILKK